MKALEEVLKKKFASNYVSVREAFLNLDDDFNGVIDCEDVLRHFKPEDNIDYYDLLKLMKEKDSKGVGTVGYSDFSRWLGGAIHQVAGFYFRHDSQKNPEYDRADQLHQRKFTKENTAAIIASNLGPNADLERKVMEKMKYQWKKIRKAFCVLNIDKTGAITKSDLSLYLSSWGLTKE